MKNSKTKTIVMTALFAAIIYLTTAFLFHIPTGINNGYIHLGDAFIYMAASFLPGPYGMIAAGIGAGLSDLLSGATAWVIPTIIIKPIMAYAFTSKSSDILCGRNLIAIFLAGVIGIGGYYLAEGIMFGNFVTPLAGILMNSIQAIGSGVVYVVLAYALDKSVVKRGLIHKEV